MTQGSDFTVTSSKTQTGKEIKEKESLVNAIEEAFKLWVESKDGVVAKRTIDAIAERHKVDPNLLEPAWQDFLRAVAVSGWRRKGTSGQSARARVD
ncbi:MAG: hypothetical protein ABR867_02255 [Nitrososphaerales archaeon]|jgi:hypothetical protein